MQTVHEEYLNSINLREETDFPYLVLKVVNGKSFPLTPAFGTMHWHEDLQFIYVIEGTICLKTLETEEIISAGEGVFINKNVVHMVEKISRCQYTSFLFPDYFLAFYLGSNTGRFVQRLTDNKDISLIVLYDKNPGYAQALQLLRQLQKLEEQKTEFYRYEVLSKLTELWLCLLKNTPVVARKQDNLISLRTRKFLQYIEKHYAEEITLEAIARSGNVSKSECLRCFKVTLQTTPYKYLMDYRLAKGKQLLEESTLAISEIAVQIGFNQQSYFTKCFKEKMHCTPKEYRQQNR